MTTATSQATSTPSTLPAILCLHGGGSNETVFKIQTRRIVWSLSTQFRFVFAQAPYEGDPGTGMLPVFESCAPFYKWATRRFMGLSAVDVVPGEEREAVDGVLRAVMDANGGVDSFVGVMGFSQGARLACGLMLRQKMAEVGKGECWTRFRFAVMIGGPFPPMALCDREDGLGKGDYELLREMPAVVAWGADDPYKEGIMRLGDACDSENCFQYEFEGSHHLPLTDREARDLCDYIMAAWYAAGGRRIVGSEKY